MSKKGTRDDFPEKTKHVLAKRVNYICSNPNCRQQTSGPHEDPNKATIVGEAAHITAASPGGARYDPSMPPDERKSASNGIWLCANCADLVDKDEKNYPVDLLKQWKSNAEGLANNALHASPTIGAFLQDDDLKHLKKISQQITATILPDLDQTSNIYYGKIVPMLDVPPLVEKVALRSSTVSNFLQTIKTHTLTAIQGDYGCGKTQLAVLITEQHANIIAWISLRNTTINAAATKIDEAIFYLTNIQGIYFRREAYKTLASKHKNTSLIVIDDLPRLDGADEVSRRLLSLVTVFNEYGHRILTTSNYELPNNILNKEIISQTIPPFNREEIRELLEIAGAPTKLIKDGFLNFVSALTKGNVTLIVALLKYLSDKNWVFSYKEFEDLIREKYKQPLTEQIINRLVNSVDSQERELLYRLDLTFGLFSTDEVSVVSQIEPIIEHPLEKFNNLKGLWIQKETNDLFELTPLVRSLGKKSIPSERQRSIHFNLGNNIFFKEGKNQYDAQKAVYHFAAAEEHNNAIIVLILAFQSMLRVHGAFDDLCLGLLYNETIPSQIPNEMRIVLRGYQIAINQKLGREVGFLIDDLYKLIKNISPNNIVYILGAIGAILAGCNAQSFKWARLYGCLLETIRILQYAKSQNIRDDDIVKTFPYEFIILLPTYNLKNENDLSKWIDYIENIPIDIRTRVFTSEYYLGVHTVLHDSLWLNEYEKPENEQDWEKIISICDKTAQRFLDLGMNTLWASAQRTKIITIADNLNDIERAEKLAKDLLGTVKNDKLSYFLISASIGTQLYYKKLNDKAYPWLYNAITKGDGKCSVTLMLIIYNQLSCIIGDSDNALSLEYAEKAWRYASEKAKQIPLAQARTYGELGVAKWLSGKPLIEVYECFNKGVNKLINEDDNNIHMQALFMSFGHSIGYLMSLSTSGKPPETTNYGEVYTPPFRGMFYAANEAERAALYDKDSAGMIMVQLALWAEATCKDDDAFLWANKAKTYGLGKGRYLGESVLREITLLEALLKNDIERCMSEAKKIGEYSAIHNLLYKNIIKEDDLDKKTEELLGIKPNENWKYAELNSSVIGFMPATIRIFYLSLYDNLIAIELKDRLQNILIEMEQTASCPLLWKMSAELIGNVFNSEISAKIITSYIDEYNKQEFSSLHAISYCGLFLKTGIRLEHILSYQLATIPWILKQTKQSSMLQRNLIIPFFEEYWLKMFKEQRFRFNAPRMVENDLRKAKNLNGKERLIVILKSISDSLSVPFKREDFEK